MIGRVLSLGLGLMLLAMTGCTHQRVSPPPVAREFRAAWVATVSNIDWPSRPNLSTPEQQREMIAILDRAVELKLNAIILQVRTSCDALYPSNLEPWSEYLTGTQGKAPEPGYDPLQMWVAAAHQRGLELHAWFNPFRARQKGAKSEESASHISRTHPELVKRYGDYLWLDPGEPAAQEHTVNVFMDVVRRYDIDGVHIDDYFYPYPLPNLPFPDEPSWEKYVAGRGTMSRADWRRDNINRTIERVYREIKREKPHVKFGISPFGIWKPGHPAVVRGFNQYESLYADAKLWLNKGWCDYFTPQLYWKISATSQPYPGLLDWWIGENLAGRHLWPGNIPSRIADGRANWEAREILDQIAVTRARYPAASGNVHFSMKPLMQDRGGLAQRLREGPYAEEALVPASRWLDGKAPRAPKIRVRSLPANGVTWEPRGGETAWLWVVYSRQGDKWSARVLPGNQRNFCAQDFVLVDAVAVSAVDRCGNESRPAVWVMPSHRGRSKREPTK